MNDQPTTPTKAALLEKVANEAAGAAGLAFTDVEVETDTDGTGEPSYFFTYTISRVNNLTGKIRSALSLELRDRLLEKGDDRYPYIRITHAHD